MSEPLLAPRWDERLRDEVARAEPIRTLAAGSRLAVISDAHGNLTALQAASADIARQNVDLVVAAGDLAQGGCRPDGVMDFLGARGWPAVLGNSDALLLDLHDGLIAVPPEVAWLEASGRWSLQRLGPQRVAALRSLPLALRVGLPGGRSAVIVHATTWSLEALVPPDAPDVLRARMLREARADLLVHGHIHSAYHRAVDGGLLVSVGALSGSNDADGRTAYTLFTFDAQTVTIEVRRVTPDLEAERAAIRASGMPQADRVLRLVSRAGGPWPVRVAEGAIARLPYGVT
ncbi:MAG TPA: metallophosphoesterase family protein [bacterium]|nr:metallophosphoesterase family protein [bacterium]